MSAPAAVQGKGKKGKQLRLVLLAVAGVAVFLFMRRTQAPASTADQGAPATVDPSTGLAPGAGDVATAGALAGNPDLTALATELHTLESRTNDQFGHFQDLEEAYGLLKQGQDPFGAGGDGSGFSDIGGDTSGASDPGTIVAPSYGPGNGLDWNGLPLAAALLGQPIHSGGGGRPALISIAKRASAAGLTPKATHPTLQKITNRAAHLQPKKKPKKKPKHPPPARRTTAAVIHPLIVARHVATPPRPTALASVLARARTGKGLAA